MAGWVLPWLSNRDWMSLVSSVRSNVHHDEGEGNTRGSDWGSESNRSSAAMHYVYTQPDDKRIRVAI
jgi:hypothetical protein